MSFSNFVEKGKIFGHWNFFENLATASKKNQK